ncbi:MULTISPECIES: DNA recombination protein RmuC [unclassified Siphonobacter]|uniref:DNA recombination protein RmuC n=1 Tax=unclassified Siphonobacter TaxID=2635712 RepID=UPI00277FEEF7|nr:MULTISPECIES: DNA recombination protein RmuC [unclassified Siphonobacter]MDQ1087049.1 DNA recombination protein RmuC [Siphonobacter sp. SORGH_AS_1065]MDR6193161.1 DNA recombination protein RmuC [Siphonobacter sp. SORGH_AS_0500]
MSDFLFLFTGLLIGAVATWMATKGQKGSQLRVAEHSFQSLQNETSQLRSTLEKERQNTLDLNRQLAALEADYRNLEDKLHFQQEELSSQFRHLANDLLEEKSRRFTEQNQLNLNQLLHPLGEKIQAFERKIEENYKEELRDKVSLLAEVRKLHDLSQRLSQDADNLAKALKGDTRQQGNWGEVILEKVLERSGLMKGAEYNTQVLTQNVDNALIRPDVVIYLPDNKHLIVDAKVSLLAYERCMGCDDEMERGKYLTAHLSSVRSHIRLLAEKKYETAQGLLTPDFVLLFMPIEPAFSLAIQSDAELFNFAWERRIVLVSPTTLLATLRTVSSIWKFEKQSKNSLEIARLSGELYDKFEGFIRDLQKVGDTLKSSQNAYDEAVKKLAEGKGNMLRTAEKIKALGARSTKDLPKSWLDQAEE